MLQVFQFYLSNIFKYLFWQLKLFDFISENVSLIKQKHYSELINLIILNLK